MRTPIALVVLIFWAGGCVHEHQLYRARRICELFKETGMIARVTVRDEPVRLEKEEPKKAGRITVEVSASTVFKGVEQARLSLRTPPPQSAPWGRYAIPQKGTSAIVFATLINDTYVVPQDGWFTLDNGLASNAAIYRNGIPQEEIEGLLDEARATGNCIDEVDAVSSDTPDAGNFNLRLDAGVRDR